MKLKLADIHPVKWIIWSIAAIALCYEYILRVAPSVFVAPVLKEFDITPVTFGLISASYFYIYAPMQLPVGGIIDRYGARWPLVFAMSICGLGSLVFAYTKLVSMLYVGRFLMGLGSTFCFVGLIYISNHYFPPKRSGLLVGLGNSIGILGCAIGLGPTSDLVSSFGWRGTMEVFGLIGLLISIALYIAIRNDPKPAKPTEQQEEREKQSFLAPYKLVLSHYGVWLSAIGGFFLYTITSAFGGLWAASYLELNYGIGISAASYATSMFYIGWILGAPIFTYWSDLCERRKPFLVVTSFIITIFMAFLIIDYKLPIYGVYIVMFIVGLLSGAQLLCYSYSIDQNPVHVKGVATSFTNFFVMMSASIVQPVIGYLITYSHLYYNHTDVINAGDYRFALTILPIFTFIATILFAFMPESKSNYHKNYPNYV